MGSKNASLPEKLRKRAGPRRPDKDLLLPPMLLGRQTNGDRTMKKLITIILALLVLVPFVSADSSAYDITSVYVNGIHADEDTKVQVELDSTAQLIVFLEGTGETTDVRIHAWIGGYEYGDIDVYSEVFDVEDGVSYKKYLYIDIPEDLDVDSHEYTLRVEVFDSEDLERKEYTLYFEQERHKVLVDDVMLSSTTVAPGDYVGVKVRLENQGETDEEDVQVTVFVPDLGVSQRVYLDELLSGDQDEANAVYLTIPEDAREGDYEMYVTVSYNNGYSETTDLTYFSVDGSYGSSDENALVSMESIGDLVAGEDATYKIQITNLDTSAKTFTLTVDGIAADYTEDVTVAGRSTGELYFTLSPEDAGLYSVLVEVRSDDGLVAQDVYNVGVDEKTNVWPIALAVVLGVLVIVAVVVLVKRLQ